MFIQQIAAGKALALGAISGAALTGAIMWDGGDNLDRVNEMASQMKDKIVTLSNDSQVFAGQVSSLKEEETKLKASIESLKAEKAEIEANLAGKVGELNKAQAALDAALAAGTAKDGEIAGLQAEVTRQQGLVVAEQKKLTDLKAEINRDAQAAYAAAQEIANAATKKYNDQKAQADVMKAQLQKANAHAEQLEGQVATYKQAADAAAANAAKPHAEPVAVPAE